MRGLCVAIGLALAPPAMARDGAFTPGVETASKAALSSEIGEHGFEDRLFFAWAPGPDLRLSAAVPLRQATSGLRRRVGVGDLSAGVRALLLRRERENGAGDRLALDAGFVVPTGDTGGRVPIGGGSTDFEGGVSYGYSTNRWFAWTGLRGRLATQAGSDLVAGHAALAVRAARVEELELFLLLEAQDRHVERARRGGDVIPRTEERTRSLAPGAQLTLGEYRVKGGVLIPVETTRRDDPPWRLSFALEILR